MPKKNRRNSSKYPALDPELNLKSRYELLDYDYLDKLKPEELDYLNRFTEEYSIAKLDHKGKKIHKKKEHKKDCYDRNNSRNRCILSRQKSAGLLGYLEEEIEEPSISVEDELIDRLDTNEKILRKTRKS